LKARVDGRARRASYLALSFLLALCSGACARGPSPDVDTTVAHWQSSLATALRPGASAAAVEAVFKAHGLTPGRTAAGDAIYAVIPVESHWYDLVTADIHAECRLDAGRRLTVCIVRARYTGP
jgi:hypothetical protein